MTIGTLNSNLNSWIGRSDFGASQYSMINTRVLSKLNSDIHPISEVTATTITNVSGQNAWTLPTNFILQRSVTLSGRDTFLRMAPDRFIDGWNEQDDIDTPEFYTIRGNSIVVSPSPGTNTYTINLVYAAKFGALTSNDSTNNIITDFPHIWHHLQNYYAAELTQDMLLAQHHLQMYETELAKFKALQVKKKVSGSSFNSFNQKRRVP